MMQFEEFVSALEAQLRDTPGAAFAAKERAVTWTMQKRVAIVALVPPLNVSVTLSGAAAEPVTNWYPIDAALVTVVSNRVAGFLGAN
jgi:hypothetical protein